MAGPPPPHGFTPPPAALPPAGYPMPGALMRSPQAPYGIDPLSGLPYSDKQKIVAFMLQIFLGSFGAGRFYTGHTGMAIAQLVVTWVTCGIGGIWPLIDGIMMLTGNVRDVNGLPLRE